MTLNDLPTSVVAAKMKVSYGANALEVFVVLGVKDGAEFRAVRAMSTSCDKRARPTESKP